VLHVVVAHEVRTAPALLLALGLAGVSAAQTPLPDPLEAGWHGEKVCEKLHEDAETRILWCTFPPGVGHERHFHAPNFGYVVAGGRIRLTDADGTRDVDLVTGSGSFSEGVAWHEGVNVGDSTIVYLIVEPKRRGAE
jgi:quercetin dioxygenase-like cupin family protein